MVKGGHDLPVPGIAGISIQRLTDVLDLGRGDVAVASEVRIGVPYDEILKTIDKEKADLLLMGTKGRSDLVDLVIGSCAQELFRRSPIPLLSLRIEASEDG